MKKFIFGLSAIAIIITGIFTFAGCEKEEFASQENNSLQLAFSHNDTLPDGISITALSNLPEMHDFMHVISQQLAAFTFNVESNDEFTDQVNEICDNISNADDQEDINLYYSMLSQMVFPIDELNIITTDGDGIQYRPNNCIRQLSTAYNNLDSALNETLPAYEEMSEELKLQILAQMFEQNLIDNGYICGGPLEDKRDFDLNTALIEYCAAIAGAICTPYISPFLFVAATTIYCRKVLSIWRDYYDNGGTEPKGQSCKICES